MAERECPDCNGEGEIEHPHMLGAYVGLYAEAPPDPPLVTCETCDGTGILPPPDDEGDEAPKPSAVGEQAREPGWHWMRIAARWQPARWTGKYWALFDGRGLNDEFFDEVGPRLTPPGTEPAAPEGRTAMSDTAIVHPSGNPIADRLRVFLFHADGEISIDLAARLASVMAEELFDADALEQWGIRLSAEMREGTE